jgi:hypothetical protein
LMPSFHIHVATNTFTIIFFFLMPSFHIHVATSTFTINYFFLLLSFHSPWIIVTIINYIDNKRNSITMISFNVRLCNYRAQIPSCNHIIQSDDTYCESFAWGLVYVMLSTITSRKNLKTVNNFQPSNI